MKLVVIADYPPKPRSYFYDPSGHVTEPLFAAMMKVLCYKPATKDDGLREFQQRGWLFVNATYRLSHDLKSLEHREAILQSYPTLLAELTKMVPDKSTPILLIRAVLRRLLESRLTDDGFTVLNFGSEICSPLTDAEKFREDFAALCERVGLSIGL